MQLYCAMCILTFDGYVLDFRFFFQPSVAVVQEQFVLKDPPASFEFIAEPPSISAYDIDVVSPIFC